MDTAKSQLKRFKKNEILSARRKRRGLSQEMIKFKDKLAEFVKDNTSMLNEAYQSTKTAKRSGGQKSLKFNLDSFRVIVTKMT